MPVQAGIHDFTMSITRLTLTDFRSYAALRFAPSAPLCVFTGPNGSGKTNLLEAVSLLVPGRGLRGARIADLARRDGPGTWAAAAEFADNTRIGTGTTEPGSERRAFRLNGEPPRAQSEIAARLSAVWLTPQMDRLFTDPAGGRRRFLDRLVIALEPTHARDIAAFGSAAAQRNRLLAESGDPAWLAGLEDAMARHATAGTAGRLALLKRLNAALAAGVAAPFPPVALSLDCPIATRLATAPALKVEDWLREALAAARPADAQARAASLGPQKADLAIADAASGRPAGLSSTGQQKAMLLGIILGHAAIIARARGVPPLLLLDEPLVHLDEAHRLALFAALSARPFTAWLTGTDAAPFAPFTAAACHAVANSHISAP